MQQIFKRYFFSKNLCKSTRFNDLKNAIGILTAV